MLTRTQKNIAFDQLWENSIIGMALVSEDGRFLDANPAFCDMVEYSLYELQSIDFATITHPSDIKADVQMAERVSSGMTPGYIMKKRYITKTGKIIWVTLKVIAIEENGNFRYLLSQIIEDVNSPTDKVPNILTAKGYYRRKIWNTIKDYAAIILALLGAAGIIISNILKG